MSNRTPDQITAEAEMRLSHMAQIEALTMKGLSERERVERFGKAASLGKDMIDWCVGRLAVASAAWAVWNYSGERECSLFAHLPGCYCPVLEKISGVPREIPWNWNPDAAQLKVFSRIQLERRFPK